MLQYASINILQTIFCRINTVLSAMPFQAIIAFGVTHTHTFEDALYPVKHIGIFKKRRKATTDFRRA